MQKNNNQNNQNRRRGFDLIFFIVVILAIVAVVLLIRNLMTSSSVTTFSYQEFVTKVNEEKIVPEKIIAKPAGGENYEIYTITGTYKVEENKTAKFTLKFNRSSKVQIFNASNTKVYDQSSNPNNVTKTAIDTLSIFSRNNGASMWSKAKLYYFKMYKIGWRQKRMGNWM